MSASPESVINQEAVKKMREIISRVGRLEANDYYRPTEVTGVTSNPPTDAELDSLLGTPDTFGGNIVVLVKDTTNSRYWLVFGDTTSWYHVRLDLADSEIVGAKVYHNANQSLGTGSSISLSFNNEIYDIGSFHDNSTNNSRLTAPIDGIYSIKANVRWESNSSGRRDVQILLDGGGSAIGSSIIDPCSSNVTDQNVAIDYELSAGQYVEVRVFQNSGVSLNILNVSDVLPHFSIHLVY